MSSKRMQAINDMKRIFTLTREDQMYKENYQKIYKRVLREAKKGENYRNVQEWKDRPKGM